jgi:hypothetical protein
MASDNQDSRRNESRTRGSLMAEHEPCIGQSDDWYTPGEIFDALGLVFDVDPCSPGPDHWVPARQVFTKRDDGLSQPWHGLVFMNPHPMATQVF